MLFFLLPLSILLIGYCGLLLLYTQAYRKLQIFQPSSCIAGEVYFSVLIPARNEEANIERCIKSIVQNNYPLHLFEIIVIDDFSSDNTAAIVKQMMNDYANVQLIELKNIVQTKINSYKKKAIEAGIAQSKGTWIVTTDADCIVSNLWLYYLNAAIVQHECFCIGGPVQFINTHTFLSIFQCLDFMSLQGITAASVSGGFHYMANGANLAYKKSVFYEVEGFKGIDAIASGDDMLLIDKINRKYEGKMFYLFSPECIVKTLPMPTWSSFFNQRIRWASKATNYKDVRIFIVLLWVYFLNLAFLICGITSFFIPYLWKFFLLLFIIKILFELIFLFPVARFFKSKPLLWWFPVMQIPHIVYTVIAGGLGKLGYYNWKGRKVK